MNRYIVSVIANCTIDLVIDAADETAAKAVAESIQYDALVDEGVIRIYSTETIEDEDVQPYTEEYFA